MKNFPTSPDQLSTSWLQEALGFEVAGFNVEYFSEGAGVMAWVMRLTLDTPAGCPDSVIAKFPSPSEANRQVAGTYNMYGREVDFYSSIAGNIAVPTPACYFSAFEQQSSDFVLLLEDIGHMRIGDQVAGCSLEEAIAVVDAVADFHASAWQPTEFPDLVSHDNEAQRAGMSAGFAAGWPVVLDQFGEHIPAAMRSACARLPAAVPALLQKMCEEPVCLTHADVRLDNIFFAQDKVAFVDWQSICTSAPEQDLAYFVTQSVPISVRQQVDFVERYHQRLTERGIDYSLARCRERYTVSALYLVCYAVVIAGTLDLANERGQALGRTIIANTFTAIDELDALSLL
ncbi:MAG: phosphotransferase [Pseudomonadales bacterium]